jgi:hypothetical protein
MLVAEELLNSGGKKAWRSTHESLAPLHRLARSFPAINTVPTCRPANTPDAIDSYAPTGLRSVHDSAVPIHMLAWYTRPTATPPTCCPE